MSKSINVRNGYDENSTWAAATGEVTKMGDITSNVDSLDAPEWMPAGASGYGSYFIFHRNMMVTN